MINAKLNTMFNFDTIVSWYFITNSNVTLEASIFIHASPTFIKLCAKYNIDSQSGHALFSTLLPDDFYFNKNGILIMEGILIKGPLKRDHLIKIKDQLEADYGREVAQTFDYRSTDIIIVSCCNRVI